MGQCQWGGGGEKEKYKEIADYNKFYSFVYWIVRASVRNVFVNVKGKTTSFEEL